MNLEQAAQQYKPVPLKALKKMVSKGLLTEPLDEKDQHALQLLSQLWADEWYVARMNMSFKSDKRALMLAFPNFGKIERYILNSYLPKEHGPRYTAFPFLAPIWSQIIGLIRNGRRRKLGVRAIGMMLGDTR